MAQLERALALHQSGQIAAAEAIYRDMLAKRPDDSDALHYLGLAAYQQGRLQEADGLISRAIGLNPADAAAFSNRGAVRLAQKQFALAVADFDQALALNPDGVDVLSNKAVALTELGAFDEALSLLDAALARGIASAQLHYNRGNALLKLARREEAIAAYDRALAIQPDYADAHYNRGGALLNLQRPSEARMSLRAAVRLRPDHAEARFSEALCDLAEGEFAAGWQGYEIRWDVAWQRHMKRPWPVPQWRGETLAGKTILIHAEQGFGDTLQFCRYLPMVAARGGRVIFEVQPELMRLMESVRGVETLIAAGSGAPLPAFDFHCPLLSLPLAFGTTLDTIPNEVPYVSVPTAATAAWNGILPSRAPRVGLAWSGRPQHANDLHRSIPPDLLTALLSSKVTLVSVQKQHTDRDLAWMSQHPEIANVSDRLRDFTDTAALVSALDLVITVDTAAAHLAGALAKPVWVMLPFIAPDWRWLLNRSDSPWYPTARLFRQPAPGSWPIVIERVAGALKSFR